MFAIDAEAYVRFVSLLGFRLNRGLFLVVGSSGLLSDHIGRLVGDFVRFVFSRVDRACSRFLVDDRHQAREKIIFLHFLIVFS